METQYYIPKENLDEVYIVDGKDDTVIYIAGDDSDIIETVSVLQFNKPVKSIVTDNVYDLKPMKGLEVGKPISKHSDLVLMKCWQSLGEDDFITDCYRMCTQQSPKYLSELTFWDGILDVLSLREPALLYKISKLAKNLNPDEIMDAGLYPEDFYDKATNEFIADYTLEFMTKNYIKSEVDLLYELEDF